MKLAFNGATTMRADLPTDLLAAKQAGFEALEIWAAKLRRFLKTSSVFELRRLFDETGLAPISINSIEHITFRSSEDYTAIKQECEELSALASRLGCPYIVVVPGKLPPHTLSRQEIIDESVSVLRELGEIAIGHGVALGFEFLGQNDCSVQTLDLAAEIVTLTERNNIGLVIDSFHFYAGGSTLDMIDALDAKQLFIFHINDAEDLPREQLQDRHRLLPGLGILPLKEMIQAFQRIGYDRTVSVEIFRPEYWERDPHQIAHEALVAVEKVISQSLTK